MGLRVAHVCTMSEIAWRAHLDKYASETDMVLGKLGEKFLLTIGPEKITITPEGCCAGRPHVLPLSMVKEAKMLTSMYSMPSFVIIGEKMVEAPPDEETGEVLLDAEGMPVMVPEHFFHKFFIEGHEASIVEVCNKVDASVRLLQGQVLIAGYIEADVINSVSYFSPADSSPSSWQVTLEPKVVIAAPYLAGLDRKAKGASRPRTTSFTTGYNKKPSSTNLMSSVPLPG